MKALRDLFSRNRPAGFAERHPQVPCRVCGAASTAYDVLDFNRSCEEKEGKILQLSGIPVYYYRCSDCGFCFAPEIADWGLDEFAQRIYNDDYRLVDPDYVELRPRANAEGLLDRFGTHSQSIRHLDYGGGNGLLSRLLRQAGWQSASYDPFVDHGTRIESLGTFDLITCYEVFEHVPNPRRLMADLSSLLAANGVVLFSTWISDEYIKPFGRLTWWYAAPRNGHISLYSKQSLTILAVDFGFHFGSLNEIYHALWRQVPDWAAHILPSHPVENEGEGIASRPSV